MFHSINLKVLNLNMNFHSFGPIYTTKLLFITNFIGYTIPFLLSYNPLPMIGVVNSVSGI